MYRMIHHGDFQRIGEHCSSNFSEKIGESFRNVLRSWRWSEAWFHALYINVFKTVFKSFNFCLMNSDQRLCRAIKTSCFDKVPSHLMLDGSTFSRCSSVIPANYSIYVENFNLNSIPSPHNFMLIEEERTAFHRKRNNSNKINWHRSKILFFCIDFKPV